jgi:hypothetical protein
MARFPARSWCGVALAALTDHCAEHCAIIKPSIAPSITPLIGVLRPVRCWPGSSTAGYLPVGLRFIRKTNQLSGRRINYPNDESVIRKTNQWLLHERIGLKSPIEQLDPASHDGMADFSKWLEAGEESIFSLETEKTCQVHPANCVKPRPEPKNSQK